MTKAEQFSEISNRMIFLRKSMEQMLENVTAQGFRTEDQSAEIEMMISMADELKEEVLLLAGAAVPEVFKPQTAAVCRSCGAPVCRQYGMWFHVVYDDFKKCGKAGIPRDTWGEKGDSL